MDTRTGQQGTSGAWAGASLALMVGYARERVERVLALAAGAAGVSERSDRARPRLGARGDGMSWVIHQRGQGEFELLTSRDRDMSGAGETNKRGRISAGRMCECRQEVTEWEWSR